MRQLQFEQLTKSYRFDQELATLFTGFQYQADGITLTAAKERSLPAKAIDAPTAGIDAVFDPESSLLFICYDDRDHQMVNPIETSLSTAITQSINTDDTGFELMVALKMPSPRNLTLVSQLTILPNPQAPPIDRH